MGKLNYIDQFPCESDEQLLKRYAEMELNQEGREELRHILLNRGLTPEIIIDSKQLGSTTDEIAPLSSNTQSTPSNHWSKILLGLFACFFTWGIFLLFWVATSYFGKRSSIEMILYFSPMVGTLGPGIIKALEIEDYGKVLFRLALCPIFAVLNFCVLLISIYQFGEKNLTLSICIIGLLWFTPLLFKLFKLSQQKQDAKT